LVSFLSRRLLCLVMYFCLAGVIRQPTVTQISKWNEWVIDLPAFGGFGIDLTNVSSITIGVGTQNSPAAGGAGTMYFDDILLIQ
jgi:hypothetical protein